MEGWSGVGVGEGVSFRLCESYLQLPGFTFLFHFCSFLYIKENSNNEVIGVISWLQVVSQYTATPATFPNVQSVHSWPRLSELLMSAHTRWHSYRTRHQHLLLPPSPVTTVMLSLSRGGWRKPGI